MALEPITAVIDLIRAGLDKFFPDKMDEADKEKIKQEMTIFTLQQASTSEGAFRDFILKYEGEADKLSPILVFLRSLIRPVFTILVGVLDYMYFTASVTWSVDKGSLLKAINLIVLLFWFGERAVTNSGILEVIKSIAQSKREG